MVKMHDDGGSRVKKVPSCSVPKDHKELEEGSARDGAAALGDEEKGDSNDLSGCAARA